MIDRPLYTNRIMQYVDMPLVKILTGVRRCGKSSLLKLVQERLIREHGVSRDQIYSYRFDSMEYLDITAKEMYVELKNCIHPEKKTYFFLDEVQEIEGWERVLNSLQSDFDVDLYVTGSNSKMMSSEISTYLTGRYISFHVYTLSFSEYLSFKKHYGMGISDPKEELVTYVRLGGFPGVCKGNIGEEEIYSTVKDIYNSTVFSDIVRRYQIRKVDQLERVIKFTFNNMGNTFSAGTISKYLKAENRRLDNETISNYLKCLEHAYLIHRCSRYDVNGKEHLKTLEKFYLADTSMRYAALGYDANTVAASLENVVYLELCRRGYTVYVGKIQDSEIDFIAEKQNEKLYIQVTQTILDEKTEKREYQRLLEIEDNYPKYVLTADSFTGGNYKGIRTMHIADFLLSEEF